MLAEQLTKSTGLKGNVLVTGGAGYLGRALIGRALAESWDCSFTVISRDEQKQALLKKRYPDVRCVLGDVTNFNSMRDVFWGHDIVIHAAALKYIPEAESNVVNCVDINVDGSRAVIEAARQAEVKRVIALSTDKAVSPLNVYGATKMLMERLFVEADLRSRPGATRYTPVRYGNVIGSTGSVIPAFLEQIKKGHPLTLTDPSMTRFWITHREATDLIIEACGVGEFGITVIPNPKAMDLDSLIEACEAVVGHSANITVVGRRPGEKLEEALVNEAESLRTFVVNGFYYLLPIGRMGNNEPFELTSSNAEQITPADMEIAIREALTV